MNTDVIAPPIGSRMNRIQMVSKCIRLILTYGILLLVLCMLILAALNWHNSPTTAPSRTIVYDERRQWINANVGALWSVIELIWLLVWYRVILRLFTCFEKGTLFTAETVRYIQILGGLYVAEFLLQIASHLSARFLDGMQFWQLPASLQPILWGHLGDLLAGLFIIFVGWLLDEARKMREEQELTV